MALRKIGWRESIPAASCATAPRLSTLRREPSYDQALSPHFGGSISTTNNRPAHSLEGVLLRTNPSLHASEGASLRSSLLSTLWRERIDDKTANSRTLLKTRLILGGSVRQQSLQYQFTTRLTALYSLLGVVATTTTRMVTTTGHHH